MSFTFRMHDLSIHKNKSLRKYFIFSGLALLLLLTAGPAFAITTVAQGQELSIMVPGHPEFSAKVVVGSDGTIDYPLLAGVYIAGLTASEIRNLLIPLLMRFESEPEVFIVISQIQYVRTQIYGALNLPGKYQAPSPLNLQQLLAMAGGVTEEANIADIIIMHSEKGQNNERHIDLTSHFFSDSLAITPYLLDGDIVIVPRLNSSTSVRVFGAVHMPGETYISHSENVYDVILRTGGFNLDADTKRVRILTVDRRLPMNAEYDIYGLIDQGRTVDLPIIYPGDIVIVPTRKIWRDFTWWATWIRDLALLASSLVILRNTL